MKSGNQSSVPSFEPGTEPNGASKDGGRGRTCRIDLSFPFFFLSVPILNLQLVNQAPNPTLVLYPSLLFSAFLLKSSCSAIPYLAFSFTRSPAFCFPLASLLTPAYPRSSSLLSYTSDPFSSLPIFSLVTIALSLDQSCFSLLCHSIDASNQDEKARDD